MAYAESGAGRPVVLVHGWAGNGRFFDDMAARLARSHRVLVPTLRGHPGSERGTAPLRIETLGQDLVHFFSALDLREAIAVGWSMGAMALWAAAPALGQRLSGFVVEDMGPRLTIGADWPFGIGGNYAPSDVPATLREIEADWPAYVARFAPRMFAPPARASAAPMIAWAAGEMSKADPAAMASLWASMAEQDFRAALGRLTQPMLVLRGAESQIYPEGATAFVANAAPHASYIAAPGAGHVPHLEAADFFFNQVEAFARSLRRPETRSGGAVP